MKTLMFDMDGPLTISRQMIETETVNMLYRARERARLVLVSGTSLVQVTEQLKGVIDLFDEVYSNSGNEGAVYWKHREDFDLYAMSDWDGEVSGPVIDWRSGAMNFAACGQNASAELRQLYADWDLKMGDRLRLANYIECNFSEFQVTIGGKVSIDITLRGCGKEQIDVNPDTIFFCDSLGQYGGDERLAVKVMNQGGIVIYCKRPEITRRFLARE